MPVNGIVMPSLSGFFKDMIGVTSGVFLGVATYKQLNPFLRLLVWQAGVYFFTDLVALNFTPNLWAYYAYVPIEFGLLILAAASCTSLKIRKFYLGLIFTLFMCIFLCELSVIEFLREPIIVSIIFSYLFITLLYIYLIYVVANSSMDRFSVFAIVLAAIGIVCYCAGSIPCLAALKDVYLVSPQTVKKVYQNTVVLLGQVRYFFLAVACGLFAWRILTRQVVKE